jgi:hypothetical protein
MSNLDDCQQDLLEWTDHAGCDKTCNDWLAIQNALNSLVAAVRADERERATKAFDAIKTVQGGERE